MVEGFGVSEPQQRSDEADDHQCGADFC